MAHPRMYDDSIPAIRRLRKICLALPEVFEKEAWGDCTFRVDGGSMFAMTDCNHHDSGHVAVWIKAPPMAQEILANAAPERFFVPPYVGRKGWVGVRLDYQVDWEELAELLSDGYRMSVAKRRRARAAPGRDEAATARKRRPRARTQTPRTKKARAKR